MNRVVVDSSLAIKWYFVEEDSNAAIALLRAWSAARTTLVVPSWFMCEFANFVHRRVRSGNTSLRDAQDTLPEILRFVEVRDYEPNVSVRGLAIASELRWPASYDPHYIALAEYLDCEFWTADLALWRGASAQFPRVNWIGQVVPSPGAKT